MDILYSQIMAVLVSYMRVVSVVKILVILQLVVVILKFPCIHTISGFAVIAPIIKFFVFVHNPYLLKNTSPFSITTVESSNADKS